MLLNTLLYCIIVCNTLAIVSANNKWYIPKNDVIKGLVLVVGKVT